MLESANNFRRDVPGKASLYLSLMLLLSDIIAIVILSCEIIAGLFILALCLLTIYFVPFVSIFSLGVGIWAFRDRRGKKFALAGIIISGLLITSYLIFIVWFFIAFSAFKVNGGWVG